MNPDVLKIDPCTASKYFSPSCSVSIIQHLASLSFEFPFSLSQKDGRILRKLSDYEKIDFENRQELWLKLSGGEEQISHFNSEAVFNFKCEEIKDNKLLLQLNEYDIASHDCFTSDTGRNACCLSHVRRFGIAYVCSNPHCGTEPKVFASTNFINCCIYFHISKHVSLLAIECDPFVCHLPILSNLCSVFSIIYEHNYQVYASLVGILKNKKLENLDKSVVKSAVSSHILRYFIIKLVRKQFCHRPRHPLLLQLYKCRHKQLCTNIDENSDFWIILDWDTLLFQNLTSDSLILLMDAFLVKGLPVLYKSILFYIYLMFDKLNLEESPDLKEFDPEYIIFLLYTTMRSDISANMVSKAKSAVRKLKIRDAKLNRLYKKLSPLVSTICTNITRLQSQTRIFSSNVLINDHKWPSDVIDSQEWAVLMSWLPYNIQLLEPVICYSSDLHGWSLHTLYDKSQKFEPIILIIKTECSSVFGGYLNQALMNRINKKGVCQSFGTGETFVFSIRPAANTYPWVMLEGSAPQSMRGSVISKTHKISATSLLRISEERINKAGGITAPLVTLASHDHKDKISENPLSKTQEISESSVVCHEEKPSVTKELFAIADDTYISIGGGYLFIIKKEWLCDLVG